MPRRVRRVRRWNGWPTQGRRPNRFEYSYLRLKKVMKVVEKTRNEHNSITGKPERKLLLRRRIERLLNMAEHDHQIMDRICRNTFNKLYTMEIYFDV